METAIVCFILLLCGSVQGSVYFDCRREGQNCVNDGICQDDGKCKCTSKYSGYDCSFVTRLNGAAPCTSKTDSCGSDGGLCYSEKGKKACRCPEEMYGEHCEKKRFEVTCSNDSMLIMMFPAGLFTGDIYVDGEKNIVGCMFSKSDLPAERNGSALNVPDVECGGVVRQSGNVTRSRTVIVQYDTRYFTSLDTNVTVTCGEGTNTVQAVIIETTRGEIQHDDIDNTPNMDSSIVQFNIKLRDGSPVSTDVPVPLDEQLTFEFIKQSPDTVKTTCSWKNYSSTVGSRKAYLFKRTLSLKQCLDACQRPACLAMDYEYSKDRKYVGCALYHTHQLSIAKRSPRYTLLEYTCVVKTTCSWKNYSSKLVSPNGYTYQTPKTPQKCLDACQRPACVAVNYQYSYGGKYVVCRMYHTHQLSIAKRFPGFTLQEYTCVDHSGTIRVEYCTATSKQSGKDQEKLKIIENSCPSEEIGKLMIKHPTKANDTTVTFQLQPFKFNNNTAISVSCSIKVCPDGKERFCDAVTCVKPTKINSRKRRSVAWPAATVEKTFTIKESTNKRD